ncbi:MAG: universal stress protein [Gemmatimonadetes bacterium]|nr:universal stress protein [Gemmatimonadota bacterium]
MFTRLLVGLDGSAGAESALTVAIDLARRFRSTIVLAAIVDVRVLEAPLYESAAPLWTEGVPLAPVSAELGLALDERADKLLEAGAARARGAGLTVETVRAVGLVDEELLRLAGQAEAIVVGRRGELHGAPGSIGEVTAHIIKKSPKPVLVAGERPSPCDHPVVAYDGREHSSQALALAARYAGAVGVKLDVVHVADDPAAGDELLARAGAFLSGQGVGYETHRLTGGVAAAVAGFIEGSGADLLAAGAHESRRHSWGIGSTAEKLLKATTIPVIVNR